MPQEEWGLHIWGWTYLLWKRWNNRWPACGFLPRPGETKPLLFVVVVVCCNLVICNAAVLGKSMVKWLTKQWYFALQLCSKTRWKAMLRVLPPVYCNNQVFLTVAWIPTSDRIKLHGRQTCYKTSWPWAGKKNKSYRKSSIHLPLSNKPHLFFRGRKSISPPPLSHIILRLDYINQSLRVDRSMMVYSSTGISDLFLIMGCMTSDFLYLSFSTLYSKSLWGINTVVFAKLNKHPFSTKPHVSIKPPPPP